MKYLKKFVTIILTVIILLFNLKCNIDFATLGDSNNQPVVSSVPGTTSTCGDGIIQSVETCDDSNNIDGDGCNSICQSELNLCNYNGICDGSEIPDTCAYDCPVTQACNFNEICDVSETATSCITDCDSYPVISDLTISNVTATSANITVTAHDADGLYAIRFYVTDSSGSPQTTQDQIVSGTFGTFTKTISYAPFPEGTIVYPYVRVEDVFGNQSALYYNQSVSSAYFTYFPNYNISNVPLTSAVIPAACNFDGICDTAETVLYCISDCNNYPTVSELTISNVTSSTVDITVSAQHTNELYEIMFGFSDSYGNCSTPSFQFVSGTSGTFTKTVNHALPAGTIVYPCALIQDINGLGNWIIFKQSISPSFFTYTIGQNTIISNILASSALVPVPGIYCGNSVCDSASGENYNSCPVDCPFVEACGNGTCGTGENYSNCQADCSYSDPNEPNDTQINGTTIVNGVEYSAALDPGTDIDIYKIYLLNGKEYTFKLNNLPQGNVTVSLYDEFSVSNWNWTFNQTTGNTARSGTITAQASGIHYIVVSTTANEISMSPYTLRVDTDQFEPNDSETLATKLKINEVKYATLDPSADIDIYKIAMISGENYTYYLDNLPIGATKVELYDTASGYWFWNWNQTAANTTRTATITSQLTGVHYLKIQTTDSGISNSSYSLRIETSEHESNNTEALASNMIVSEDKLALISPSGDADFFKVNLNAGTTYTYSIYNLPLGNMLIYLYDATLASSWNWTWNQSATNTIRSASILSQVSGPHYIKIYPSAGETSSSPYFLRIDALESEPNNTTGSATILTLGEAKTAMIDLSTDMDIYKLNMNAGTNYTYTLFNLPNGWTKVELYDAGSISYWSWDWNQTGPNTVRSDTISAQVSGMHYLKVYTTDNGVSTSSYTLKVE